MLPDFKVKRILSHKRKRKPAVTAQWVVDCITHMKLLPVEPYLLPQLREAFRLNPAFAPRASTDPASDDNDDDDNDDEDEEKEEEEDEEKEEKEEEEEIDGKEEEEEEEEEVVAEDVVEDEAGFVGDDQFDDANGDSVDVVKNKKKESSPVKFARRTTGNDPNYLQNFLKNSRLHLIGSFRPKIGVESAAALVNPPEAASVRSAGGGQRPPLYAHVDIDCFFAQVALLTRPELRDKPVAVAHSGGPPSGSSYLFDSAERQGEDAHHHRTYPSSSSSSSSSSSVLSRGGEISSANYVARAFGVKAGTFLKSALEKCPNLIVLPYDFDKIRSVSEQVHTLFHKLVKGRVEVLSCDEAFLDLTELDDPVGAVAALRRDIFKQTGCTVSAGIGRNKLFARIATSKAKPDGLVVAPSDPASINAFLGPLPASELPLVGWEVTRVLTRALGRNPDDKSLPKPTVDEVRRLGIHELQKLLGPGRGGQIYNYACGVDDREFSPGPKARQSVGCEISYGVRFDNDSQLEAFLRNQLSPEVTRRLEKADEEMRQGESSSPLKAASVTLKVMIRVPGAREPSKHIGHGHCTSHSRTERFKARPLFESNAIADACLKLYKKLQADATQVRGLGIQLGDLKRSKKGAESAMMKRFLGSSSSADPRAQAAPPDSKRVKKPRLEDTPQSSHTTPQSLKKAVLPQRLGEFLGEEAEDLLLSTGNAAGEKSLDPAFLARLAVLPQDIRLEQIKEAQRLQQQNERQKETFTSVAKQSIVTPFSMTTQRIAKARSSAAHSSASALVLNPVPRYASTLSDDVSGPDFSDLQVLSSWLTDSTHLQPGSISSDESTLCSFAINLIRSNRREDAAIFLRRLNRLLSELSSRRSASSGLINSCLQRIVKKVLDEHQKWTGSKLIF